jgi:hypothetical protein
MKVLLDFSKSGEKNGIDNMHIWMIFCGLESLMQGDKRFFDDKEELINNVKYVTDYLKHYGKNALFENKHTKDNAKKYMTILSKLSN